jgi:CcmD family protein
MIRKITILVTSLLLSGAGLLAQAGGGQPPSATDGFVPVTSLPPEQQLPAAPYLVAAYAFIWVALLAYLWSIWRRLGKVEAEMHVLETRRK